MCALYLSAGVTSEQEPILELSDLTNINDPPPAYQTFYDNHGADADALPPPPSYEEAVWISIYLFIYPFIYSADVFI